MKLIFPFNEPQSLTDHEKNQRTCSPVRFGLFHCFTLNLTYIKARDANKIFKKPKLGFNHTIPLSAVAESMNEKSHDWFYMKRTIFSEDQEGPISEAELKKQIFAGIIKPETKLASPTRTKGQWQLLKSIPTLLTHYESGVTERRHQKLLKQQAKAAAKLADKEHEQNSNLNNSSESVTNITSTPNLSPTHDHPQQSSQQIPSILERASQLNAFGRWDKFCTTCGCIGRPITKTKGSIIVELAMWLLFCLPGVIYSVWRMTSRYKACPNCLSPNVIPLDSPVAIKMLRE